MYNLRLCSLFLVGIWRIASTAPTSGALALTLPSTTTTAGSNNSSTTISRLLNPSSLSETVVYPIPDSTITLLINPRPSQTILPSELSLCLFSTSRRALNHIRQYGDGPLAQSDDPFKGDPASSCKFAVRSWKVMTPDGEVTYLTYGIVYNILRGLSEYMQIPEPHYYFISFTAKDAEKGTVGVGSIGPRPGN